jgi:hypothetical protein
MKNSIIKDSAGVFKAPEKSYYFGKIKHGSPYFEPMNFVFSIIRIRKLKPRTPEEVEKKNEQYKHNKNKPDHLYSNMPMVRRASNKIVKAFGNNYYVTWGKPFSIKFTELGWKDKYNFPRFEWVPQFVIHFFGLQFCKWWVAPKLEGQKWPDNDKYYEMMLWFVKYSDKDIEMAEKEWGWVDSDTKKSTWDKKYLV